VLLPSVPCCCAAAALRCLLCFAAQAWTEQAQEEDADVDAEPSDGGEWGDLSDSEDDSEDESTRQGGFLSHAPAGTLFSTSTVTGNASTSDSDSGDSDADTSTTSTSSSSSSDGSEAGLFGDPSLSIPPHLHVAAANNKQRPGATVGHTAGHLVSGRCSTIAYGCTLAFWQVGSAGFPCTLFTTPPASTGLPCHHAMCAVYGTA
jgi:hypothetical protein